LSIPADLQLAFRGQEGSTHLCQRARPAVVSSLAFQASLALGGSPLWKTVSSKSSRNCCACCAYSSRSFCSATSCAHFEVLPEPRGVGGVAGVVGWVLEEAGCLPRVAVRFLGGVSRDGAFVTGGVILIGLFADLVGSLKWRSDRDRPLG